MGWRLPEDGWCDIAHLTTNPFYYSILSLDTLRFSTKMSLIPFESMTTRTKLFWVGILYFAEGFPFGLITDFFPVYFRFQGISLKDIGLMSLASLPWGLKFLWAPALDYWGSRRAWVVGCQLALVAAVLVMFLLPPEVGPGLWVLLISVAVFSATQDISIDAYTIELLDKKEMGPANGLRVTTYRIALIAAGGWLVALGHFITWKSTLMAAVFITALLPVASSRAPKIIRVQAPGMSSQNSMGGFASTARDAIGQFITRPGFFFVMLFVLTFKLGDMALGPMVKPFWVDRQFTPLQIGLFPGTVGVLATILGALLGGFLTGRWGIFHALWILGLAQAASNLVYATAAALPPSTWLMYTASVVESSCGGLGTAPFLAFLMSICDKRYAATQYALLSALFGLTRSISGAFSGVATEHFGYAAYFTATFFLAFPAFTLLPWVKQWTRPSA